MDFNQIKQPPFTHTGSIVLGFSLALGFGCDSGERVLLFWAADFVFIWMPDDILRTLIPTKKQKTKQNKKH